MVEEAEQLAGLIEKIGSRFNNTDQIVRTAAYSQRANPDQPPADLSAAAEIGKLLRAGGDQASQDPSTLSRYTIWIAFLREHLLAAELLMSRNAPQEKIRERLVGVINSLASFLEIQTLFDDEASIPEWLENAGS